MEKFQKMISGPVPTLVDFYTSWCKPCTHMHAILEELKIKIGDKAHIVKLDIDEAGNSQLATRLGVQAVPTLVIYREGKVVWRRSGVTDAQTLEEAIDKILEEA